MFYNPYKAQLGHVQKNLKQTLASELAELTLRGTMSAEFFEWVKNDLMNTSLLNNSAEKCEKHCKQIQDEIIFRIQPALHTVLESYYKIRGTLKASYILGGNSSIVGIGLDLLSLAEVIGKLEEMNVLVELMFKDVSQAKKDARSLLRVLNYICIEVGGKEDAEIESNKSSQLF